MKVFAVRWRRDTFFSLWDNRSDERPPWPAGTRLVRMFVDRQQAEAFRRECEKARTVPGMQVNPFGLVHDDMGELTSLPENVLGDWLRDVGLEPPGVNDNPLEFHRRLRDWEWWWDGADLTDEQKAHVFRALDQIDFLEVVELDLDTESAPDSGMGHA